MEQPIKVAFMSLRYGSEYLAFAEGDIESTVTETNKFEAIAGALVAAGRLEIIDIDERRREKQAARTKAVLAAVVAPEPILAAPPVEL